MHTFRNRIVIILLIILNSGSLYADSNSDDNEENEQTVEQSEKEVSTNSASKNKTLKEFTPSEEISIDKPVAFPVDI